MEVADAEAGAPHGEGNQPELQDSSDGPPEEARPSGTPVALENDAGDVPQESGPLKSAPDELDAGGAPTSTGTSSKRKSDSAGSYMNDEETEDQKGPLERSGVKVRRASTRASMQVTTLGSVEEAEEEYRRQSKEREARGPEPSPVVMDQVRAALLRDQLQSVEQRMERELQFMASSDWGLRQATRSPQQPKRILGICESKTLRDAVLEATIPRTSPSRGRSANSRLAPLKTVRRGHIVLEDILQRPAARSAEVAPPEGAATRWAYRGQRPPAPSAAPPLTAKSSVATPRESFARTSSHMIGSGNREEEIGNALLAKRRELLQQTNNGLMGGPVVLDDGYGHSPRPVPPPRWRKSSARAGRTF